MNIRAVMHENEYMYKEHLSEKAGSAEPKICESHKVYCDQQYDVIIKNGTVIDVEKKRLIKANVGIIGDKIAAVTNAQINGREIIDASGLMVSPGFIDFNSHVDGNAYAASCIVRQGGTTTLGGERSLNGAVVRDIAENGFVINHGFFISQPYALRDAVGIKSIYQAANDKEIGVMIDLAARFMESGAFGICFPLELIPGVSKKEFMEIARVAAAYGKTVNVHLRKDGPEAIETFDEVFNVAARTGAKVHLVELMYMVGMGGVMERALELIDEARRSGIDVTGDSGMYDAFTVSIGSGVFDDGWESSYTDHSYSDFIISSGIHTGDVCTKALFGKLRKNSPATLITGFVCDSNAVAMAAEKEYIYISTNASDGPCYPGAGAPEMAGTFPRLIGRFVRDEGKMSLIDAIRKITILPAERFGIRDAGSIAAGKNADIVIFDYKSIIDRADYVNRGDPGAPPDGIRYVMVNGQVVTKDNVIDESGRYGRFINAAT